jgi:hypothetical protein
LFDGIILGKSLTCNVKPPNEADYISDNKSHRIKD